MIYITARRSASFVKRLANKYLNLWLYAHVSRLIFHSERSPSASVPRFLDKRRPTDNNYSRLGWLRPWSVFSFSGLTSHSLRRVASCHRTTSSPAKLTHTTKGIFTTGKLSSHIVTTKHATPTSVRVCGTSQSNDVNLESRTQKQRFSSDLYHADNSERHCCSFFIKSRDCFVAAA